MKLLAPIVIKGLYEEVICLKDMSMTHVDLGIISVKEGEVYQSYIGVYLDDWSPQNGFLIKIDSYLWPFNSDNFVTLSELRESKLNDLGL